MKLSEMNLIVGGNTSTGRELMIRYNEMIILGIRRLPNGSGIEQRYLTGGSQWIHGCYHIPETHIGHRLVGPDSDRGSNKEEELLTMVAEEMRKMRNTSKWQRFLK